ncbi:MAG: T9SS type A sorting domain-containing protein [Bacteroidota bacterium]
MKHILLLFLFSSFLLADLTAQDPSCETILGHALCEEVPCQISRFVAADYAPHHPYLLISSFSLPDGSQSTARLHLLYSAVDSISPWGYKNKLISPFTLSGQMFPEMTVSAQGEVFIGWLEFSENGNFLSVQKIDQNGQQAWIPQGIVIADSVHFQNNYGRYIYLIPDHQGGVYLVWNTSRKLNNNSRIGGRVAVTHLDQQGTLWNQPVYLGQSVDEGDFQAIRTENGEVIVTWTDERIQGHGNHVVMANRLNRFGQRLWGAIGKQISHPNQLNNRMPMLVSDGQNGVYVVWTEFFWINPQVVMQHLNPQGQSQLAYPLSPLREGFLAPHGSYLLPHPAGGYWLLSGHELWQVDPQGHKVLTVPLAISPQGPRPSNRSMYSDLQGGVYLSYMDSLEHIVVEHIAVGGSFPWGARKIVFDASLYPEMRIYTLKMQVFADASLRVFWGGYEPSDFLQKRDLTATGEFKQSIPWVGNIQPRDTTIIPGTSAFLRLEEQEPNFYDEVVWERVNEFGEGEVLPEAAYRSLDGVNIELLEFSEPGAFRVRTRKGACWDTTASVKIGLHPFIDGSFREAKKGLAVYPNPFTDRLNLSFYARGLYRVEIRILDTRGRILWQGSRFPERGLNTYAIEPGPLPKGIYLLKVFSPEKSHIWKLVKQ